MSIAKIRAALESRLLTVKGTATGFTTTNAGYALNTKVINLANVGTGIIYAGDIIKFNGDTNPYIVSVGGQANGSITLASGLLRAIPTSATAITVQSFDTVIENWDYTPVTGIPYQRYFLEAFSDEPIGSDIETRFRGMFYVRLLYPQKTGTKQIQDRAQMIKNAFNLKTSLTKDNLTVYVDKQPDFKIEGNDGDRFCGIVEIRFITNLIQDI